MLRLVETSVFNANAELLVNPINCMGVMGAGLALEFRLRFPAMFEDYVVRCERKEVRPGIPYLYRGDGHPAILNFPTKAHWKYPSRLEWIDQGLVWFAENYRKLGVSSVAFPLLGCSKGGLQWQEVRPLMERHLGKVEVECLICTDQSPIASGLEGRMVEWVNDMSVADLIKRAGLSPRVAEKLKAAGPVRRFREIAGLPGVGEQSYMRLFQQGYEQLQEGAPASGQMSFGFGSES